MNKEKWDEGNFLDSAYSFPNFFKLACVYLQRTYRGNGGEIINGVREKYSLRVEIIIL